MNKTFRDQSDTSKPYSRIQYFFWLMSGCEISILKECPTDYNRQTGIGFTIFMTTLFGCFAGGYAGYYFSEQNAAAAIVFGLIWGLLVFSIDRTLVVTLKKDPTAVKQQFWTPLVARAVLAGLIAFMISIPLELLIFGKSINAHMPEFIETQALKHAKTIAEKYNLDGLESNQSTSERAVKENQNQLDGGEPINDVPYDRIKRKVLQVQGQLAVLEAKEKLLTAKAGKLINAIPRVTDDNGNTAYDKQSVQYRNYLKVKAEATAALSRFGQFKNGVEYQSAVNSRSSYLKEWRIKMKLETDSLSTLIKRNIKTISATHDSVRKAADMQKSIMPSKNDFVLRYMVLSDLAAPFSKGDQGATIFGLLWLIRILFFTIEILPTIAKIATPIGAYDRAVYAKERDLEKDINAKTVAFLSHQSSLRDITYLEELRREKIRIQVEGDLHDRILNDVAAAQNDIAREKIENFRKVNEV